MSQTSLAHHPSIAHVIAPRPRDLGDFEVRRALPAAECRSVGPFVFFDQMGPLTLQQGQALDVRPHPHIGLATITWLFEGQIRHLDSLGSDLVIRPGEVNWMTAGRGIVHSERSPASQRHAGARLSGIQAWLALPRELEECEPDFQHYPYDDFPRLEQDGVQVALIAGSAFGRRSPVRTATETLYAELRLAAGRRLQIPVVAEEQALYIATGSIELGAQHYGAGTLLVLKPQAAAQFSAVNDCICMLLGGAPLDGKRHLWWNFVSSSLDRLELAKADWQAGRFGTVPGDDEFIPLPQATPPAN
jgi:redox-sensitive bicupin YhaK (pirin superfamily)